MDAIATDFAAENARQSLLDGMAFDLCQAAGEDPHELLYHNGSEGPEPWGERWCQYLPQAQVVLQAVQAERAAIADLVSTSMAADNPLLDGAALAEAIRARGDTHAIDQRDAAVRKAVVEECAEAAEDTETEGELAWHVRDSIADKIRALATPAQAIVEAGYPGLSPG